MMLQSLTLAGSPVAETEAFRIEVALLLPSLQSLDGQAITAEERAAALELAQQRQREAEEKLQSDAAGGDDE